MYSIYVVAEERTGSTWLTDQLATQLGRNVAYIENSTTDSVNKQRLQIIESDPKKYLAKNKVFQTHLFPVIEVLERFDQEILILRTARKDVLEQMLSYFILAKGPFSYARNISKEEVQAYLDNRRFRNELFAQSELLKQVIYYEDLFEGVFIPALSLSVNFSQSSRFKKNDTENSKYFSNYEQIAEWFQCFAQ